jgi:hypothetical protein
MKPRPMPLPLFVSAELAEMERERDRLRAALRKMRDCRRHGAILRTEFRLRALTGRILAASQGREWVE